MRNSNSEVSRTRELKSIVSGLVHVHQCSSCGRYMARHSFSLRENSMGLYECVHCHSSEALNVQIVSRSEISLTHSV